MCARIQKPDPSFSKCSASDSKKGCFCCLQWREGNLLFLEHDLQYLSSYTDKDIFSPTPILPHTIFSFFQLFNLYHYTVSWCFHPIWWRLICCLAIDLACHITEREFCNTSSQRISLNLCLYSALSLKNIELLENLTKMFQSSEVPFHHCFKGSSSVFLDGVMLSYRIQQYKWCFRVRKEPVRQERLSKTVLEELERTEKNQKENKAQKLLGTRVPWRHPCLVYISKAVIPDHSLSGEISLAIFQVPCSPVH